MFKNINDSNIYAVFAIVVGISICIIQVAKSLENTYISEHAIKAGYIYVDGDWIKQ